MKKAMEPKECNKLLGEAFNQRDIASAIALFEKDAIFTDEQGNEHVGIPAIQAAEQKVLDMDPTFTIDTIGVTVYDNIAVLRSKWHLNGTGPDGKPLELSHNGIEIVRRQADGSWQYIIDNPFFAD